jgi:TonB family protein
MAPGVAAAIAAAGVDGLGDIGINESQCRNKARKHCGAHDCGCGMTPRFVLPPDFVRRDLRVSEDRRGVRRCLALAGAILVHAAVLGLLIELRVGGPPAEPEGIPVTLVFERAQMPLPPSSDVPTPSTQAVEKRRAPAGPSALASPAADATVAQAPALAALPAPSPSENAAPARPPTVPKTATAPADPPAQKPAPAAPVPSVAGSATMTAPRSAEIAPPSPYLPYTPAQREALDKSLFVGDDNYGRATANEAIKRSVVSKHAPPLTTAQRETLQTELHTGENDAGGAPGKEKVIRDAALSKRAAPLTAEQWNSLATIYHPGRALHQEAIANASIQHSALSLRIATADQQKALDAIYHPGSWSRSVGTVPSGHSEARLLVQSEPELPAELSDRAFSFDVTARLDVGIDGAVTSVILAQPTPEPYFNQALVVALQKWHYYPAVDSGKPVASTVEVHFTISAPGVATDKKGRGDPDRRTPA